MKNISAYIISVLIVAFVVLSGCGRLDEAQTQADASKEYTFVVAADPQLFWGAIENWQQTIAEINNITPDFVVVCGDMTNKYGDEKEIAAYFETAKKLSPSIKLFHVAGNHDLPHDLKTASVELYEKSFGTPYYSFEHKKSLFIVLDSGLLKESNEEVKPLASEQMKWLKQLLADSDKKQFEHKFVFLHHPVILEKMDEPEEYFNLSVAMRNELLGLFNSHKVEFVFSGHLHQNRAVQAGNVELVVTASCGKALGDSDLGFRIVKVSPQTVEHSFYKLPDQSKR